MNNHQQKNENEKVILGCLTYSLNFKDKTASVIGYDKTDKYIIILRSIIVESNEYIVTSISSKAFQTAFIAKVDFWPGSQIKTIEAEAFYQSSIRSLAIPSSLTKLQPRWCKNTRSLTDIDVSPDNPVYKKYGKKFIIGKRTIESDNFDVLIFASRDVSDGTIPNFIKHIDSCAFYQCLKLKSIKFQEESVIESISSEAFCGSSIESISFPSSLNDLKEGWCSGTPKLTRVEIDERNERYKVYDNKFIIGKSSKELDDFDILSFCVRDIKGATIPSFIKRIGSFAFNLCGQLETVEFLPDSQLSIISKGAFLASSIRSFTVPRHVTFIGEVSFHNCTRLVKFEIPSNSEIRTIETCSFNFSPIKNFTIPPHLKTICSNTFQNCCGLRKIEIPEDSELQTMEEYAFQNPSIVSLSIPSKFIEFKKRWCFYTPNITTIEVSPKNPLYTVYEDKFIIGKSSKEEENFDVFIFSVRNIKKVAIPSYIKHIGSCAFERCIQLRTVEIPVDSQLQTIGTEAFSRTKIEYFYIPPHLTLIDEGSFRHCPKLKKIIVDENSELQTIREYAFSETAITSFYFPSHVKTVDENAFSLCQNMLVVEFDENSEMEVISKDIFKFREELIIMIPKKLTDRFNLF